MNLLTWCTQRIVLRLCPHHLSIVLLVSESDAPLLPLPSTPGCEALIAPWADDMEALCDASKRFGCRHALFMYPEAAFGPVEVFDSLLAAFHSRSSDVVSVRGLPEPVSPLLLDVPKLSSLIQRARLRHSTPHKAAAALLQLPDTEALGISMASYDLASILGNSPLPKVPGELHLETSGDLEVARAAIAAGGTLSAWWEAYYGINGRAPTATVPTLQRKASGRARAGRAGRSVGVLAVTNPSALTGAEVVFADLLTGVAAQRVPVTALVAYEGELTQRLRSGGVRVECSNEEFGGMDASAFGRLLRTLRSVRPRVVHINGHSGMAVVLAAVAEGIPVVTHVHISQIDAWRGVLRGSTRVIVVSPHLVPLVMQHDVPESRITVLEPCVDTSRFDPLLVEQVLSRRELGLKPDAYVIGMVARFAPGKRHDIVLDAVARLRTMSKKQLQILFVGEAFSGESTRAEVCRRASRRGLADCITYAGYQRDMPKVWASLDVAVLATESEGLPVSLLEALAMQVPVVASYTPGIDLALDRGRMGRIVTELDPEAFARSIAEALDEPLDSRIAKRAYIERNFGLPAGVKRLVTIYRELAVGRCRSQGSQARKGVP